MNHISLKEGRHRFDAKSPTALEERISDNTRPHWLHWMGDALLSHAQSAVRWLAFNHVVLQVLIKLMSWTTKYWTNQTKRWGGNVFQMYIIMYNRLEATYIQLQQTMQAMFLSCIHWYSTIICGHAILLQPVQMEKFALSVVLFLMRDEWKSVRIKHGALCAMTTGEM